MRGRLGHHKLPDNRTKERTTRNKNKKQNNGFIEIIHSVRVLSSATRNVTPQQTSKVDPRNKRRLSATTKTTNRTTPPKGEVSARGNSLPFRINPPEQTSSKKGTKIDFRRRKKEGKDSRKGDSILGVALTVGQCPAPLRKEKPSDARTKTRHYSSLAILRVRGNCD